MSGEPHPYAEDMRRALAKCHAEIDQLRAELAAREAEVARLLEEVREWKAEHASMAEHLAASKDEHMTRIRRELSDNDRRLRINDLTAWYAGQLMAGNIAANDGWQSPESIAADARALAAAVVEAEE